MCLVERGVLDLVDSDRDRHRGKLICKGEGHVGWLATYPPTGVAGRKEESRRVLREHALAVRKRND